jgi:hypothetical protein
MSSGRDAQNGFVHPIRIFPGKVLDEQRNVLPPLAGGGVRGHFDHGYALTSHSSQGLTTERVLVVDTDVYPDQLNSRFGYVSISRAPEDNS